VPGDSGGRIAFSEENKRGGTAEASEADKVERYWRSVCTIWPKFGLSFGSSFQQDVRMCAISSGSSSALGLTF
jgi:hypothetical protein